VSEEVLWTGKHGAEFVVDADGIGCFRADWSDTRHANSDWLNLPSDFQAAVIALFRERALGAKCDAMRMGRP
jgi:hypothetical protein